MNTSKSIDNNIAAERQVLHLLLTEPVCIKRALQNGLDADWLAADHRPLYECILQKWQSHQELVTRKAYQQYLLNKGLKKTEVYLSVQMWDKCAIGTNADANDLSEHMDKVRDGYFARKNQAYLQEFADSVKLGQYEQASLTLSNRLNKLHSTGTKNKDIFVTGGGSALMDFYNNPPDPSQIVRSGLAGIDDRMPEGFNAGRLSLIVAPTGTHKTSMQIQMAINQAKEGHRVWFMFLEDGRDAIIARAAACLTGHTKDSILKRQLPKDVMEEIAAQMNALPITFIKPHGRADAAWIDRMVASAELKPRVIYVDYLSHLAPRISRDSRNDLEISETLMDIISVAQKHDLAAVTAAQVGREGIKALRHSNGKGRELDVADIRGSQDYASHAFDIFALQWNKELSPGELRVHCLKARDAQTGSFELDINAATGQIWSTGITETIDDYNDFLEHSEEDVTEDEKQSHKVMQGIDFEGVINE